MKDFFFNGLCVDCFCKVQKDKSCVCPLTILSKEGRFYYCSFCEEFHTPHNAIVCKECAKKQDTYAQKKETFLKVGLPSVLGGLIIGLLLG